MFRLWPRGWLVVVLVAAAFALVTWSHTGHAERPTVPSDEPSSYHWPETIYANGQVVVHYVSQGLAAPPLLDEDGDGVPDYVKAVSDTANETLQAYAARGFRAPLLDSGGPDGRVDIYISSLGGQGCGEAIDPTQSADGAYIVVSQLLDRGTDANPGQGGALCSLELTVSHELFHLVQFAYPHFREWPRWLAESTAAGEAATLHPSVDDAILDAHLQQLPQQPVSLCRQDPYGASFFWQSLDLEAPEILPRYLALATTVHDPCGYHGLERLLERHYLSLAAVYQNALIQLPDVLPATRVTASAWTSGRLAPLSGRELFLTPPAGTKSVTLELEGQARAVFWVDGYIVRLHGKERRTLPLNLGSESSVSVILSSGPFAAAGWRARLSFK